MFRGRNSRGDLARRDTRRSESESLGRIETGLGVPTCADRVVSFIVRVAGTPFG